MTVPITVSPLDPNCVLQGISRAMCGVAKTIETPTLDVDYGEYCRWIWCGAAGNLSYRQWDGTDVLYTGINEGTLLPFCSIRINSTGTTISSAAINVGS